MRRQPQPVPPLAERQKPALSQTLTGPRDPRLCQSCVAPHHPKNRLQRWLECDPMDRPTRTVVVLCEQCSKRLIDPHPRLYKPIQQGAPIPGCMGVCVRCTHREGLSCSAPLPLRFRHEKPAFRAILCGPGLGGLMTFYGGPVNACSGREVKP